MSLSIQKLKEPDLTPIEEERTIQETISRKSIPISSKIQYEITEIKDLINFVSTKIKEPRNESCIIFLIPLSTKNIMIESTPTKPLNNTKFFFYNSNDSNSLFHTYFLLPPPTIAIYQNGSKITEIPLLKSQNDADLENLIKVVNKVIHNILEFGLRKGINMINISNRKNYASCGSSNGDSIDFKKTLKLGSTNFSKEKLAESGIVKKFDSMKMDSEEDEEMIKNGGYTGKEVGKLLMKGLNRGFSFMPSSVGSSKRSSKIFDNQLHNFQNGFKKIKNKMGDNFVVSKKENEKTKKKGLRSVYLGVVGKYFRNGNISEFRFLCYSVYLGLKKCSTGRLGKLKYSKPKEILGHLKEIEKNGRLQEFLIKYTKKIDFQKLIPIFETMGLEHLDIEILEGKKNKILEKIEKVFKKKNTPEQLK